MGSSSESIARPRSPEVPNRVTPAAAVARGQRRNDDDDVSGRVTGGEANATSSAGRLVSGSAATGAVALICNKSLSAAVAVVAAVVAANGRVDGIATASRLVAVTRGEGHV